MDTPFLATKSRVKTCLMIKHHAIFYCFAVSVAGALLPLLSCPSQFEEVITAGVSSIMSNNVHVLTNLSCTTTNNSGIQNRLGQCMVTILVLDYKPGKQDDLATQRQL